MCMRVAFYIGLDPSFFINERKIGRFSPSCMLSPSENIFHVDHNRIDRIHSPIMWAFHIAAFVLWLKNAIHHA